MTKQYPFCSCWVGGVAGAVYASGTGHAGFMESRSQIHDGLALQLHRDSLRGQTTPRRWRTQMAPSKQWPLIRLSTSAESPRFKNIQCQATFEMWSTFNHCDKHKAADIGTKTAKRKWYPMPCQRNVIATGWSCILHRPTSCWTDHSMAPMLHQIAYRPTRAISRCWFL